MQASSPPAGKKMCIFFQKFTVYNNMIKKKLFKNAQTNKMFKSEKAKETKDKKTVLPYNSGVYISFFSSFFWYSEQRKSETTEIIWMYIHIVIDSVFLLILHLLLKDILMFDL